MTINILFLGLSLLVAVNVGATEPMHAPLNSIFSETRQSIFVAFWNGSCDTNSTNSLIGFPSDKKIKYGFASVRAVPFDVLALKEEYGCIISAKSESGEDIEKTPSGDKFGKRFLDVVAFDKSQLDLTKGRGNGGPQFPYISVAAPDGGIFSRDIPPLESLFEFDKPGQFVVSIQLQCFVGPYGKSTSTSVHLVRFPPVKIHVIKQK
ncbi:MAG TPA: hypothetical protein VNX46_11300 [Candidatus Acidoferrum sp.]|jgi:hypothetical protein|nr:hypothetical protein [Candidatus Acidoferrum sp.]